MAVTKRRPGRSTPATGSSGARSPSGATRRDSGRDSTAVFRIAEAARHAGVSPSALRLWEQQGLVSPDRSRGSYRLYSPADLARLRDIARLRQIEGLNAAAIRRLTNRDGSGLPGPAAAPGARPRASSAIALDVALRLRGLRLAAGLSLRVAAERTGLSASFISAVERSQTGASIAALRRLATVYGTTLGDLLREPRLEESRLVRDGDRDCLEPGDGIRIESLSRAPSQLESHLFVLTPGATSDGYYAHAGEELMYMLSGSLGVWLDERDYYQLGAGDSLTFPSTMTHRFSALGTTETRLIWINTPPTF